MGKKPKVDGLLWWTIFSLEREPMKRFSVIVCLFLTLLRTTSSFIYTKNIKCRHFTLNGTRRRQQRITEVAEGGNKSTPNGGRGVEVTGVTLPNEDK
jgi:hypothetical protein